MGISQWGTPARLYLYLLSRFKVIIYLRCAAVALGVPGSRQSLPHPAPNGAGLPLPRNGSRRTRLIVVQPRVIAIAAGDCREPAPHCATAGRCKAAEDCREPAPHCATAGHCNCGRGLPRAGSPLCMRGSLQCGRGLPRAGSSLCVRGSLQGGRGLPRAGSSLCVRGTQVISLTFDSINAISSFVSLYFLYN